MISSNQKFAFIGLSTRVADGLAETKPLGDRIWATTKLPVGLDSDWKTWLGSIRAERLESLGQPLPRQNRQTTRC